MLSSQLYGKVKSQVEYAGTLTALPGYIFADLDRSLSGWKSANARQLAGLASFDDDSASPSPLPDVSTFCRRLESPAGDSEQEAKLPLLLATTHYAGGGARSSQSLS